jgi:hypothetical protein
MTQAQYHDDQRSHKSKHQVRYRTSALPGPAVRGGADTRAIQQSLSDFRRDDCQAISRLPGFLLGIPKLYALERSLGIEELTQDSIRKH